MTTMELIRLKTELIENTRCIEETITVCVEFKRLLDYLFNEPELEENEVLNQYKGHYNAFSQWYVKVRREFSPRLAANIPNLDRPTLANCGSIWCCLPTCTEPTPAEPPYPPVRYVKPHSRIKLMALPPSLIFPSEQAILYEKLKIPIIERADKATALLAKLKKQKAALEAIENSNSAAQQPPPNAPNIDKVREWVRQHQPESFASAIARMNAEAAAAASAAAAANCACDCTCDYCLAISKNAGKAKKGKKKKSKAKQVPQVKEIPDSSASPAAPSATAAVASTSGVNNKTKNSNNSGSRVTAVAAKQVNSQFADADDDREDEADDHDDDDDDNHLPAPPSPQQQSKPPHVQKYHCRANDCFEIFEDVKMAALHYESHLILFKCPDCPALYLQKANHAIHWRNSHQKPK